jgi:hypothetical protein
LVLAEAVVVPGWDLVFSIIQSAAVSAVAMGYIILMLAMGAVQLAVMPVE